MRVWDCRVIVKLPKPKKRGVECILLKYAYNSKAYRFMVFESNDSILVNIIIEFKDVIFEENKFTVISKIKDDISKSSGLKKG